MPSLLVPCTAHYLLLLLPPFPTCLHHSNLPLPICTAPMEIQDQNRFAALPDDDPDDQTTLVKDNTLPPIQETSEELDWDDDISIDSQVSDSEKSQATTGRRPKKRKVCKRKVVKFHTLLQDKRLSAGSQQLMTKPAAIPLLTSLSPLGRGGGLSSTPFSQANAPTDNISVSMTTTGIDTLSNSSSQPATQEPSQATSQLSEESVEHPPPHLASTNQETTLPDVQIMQECSTTQKSKSRISSHITYNLHLVWLRQGKLNVAALFTEWLEASMNMLENFSLLLYDSPQGQKITSAEQVSPEDMLFFNDYYHNHQVLQHGNLTGMVHFQTSTPWIKIKSFQGTYFRWLSNHRVFINVMETLVVCGFLVGAHPGYLHRDKAEEELRVSLGLDDNELPFQISSCSISVPIKDGDPTHFSFQAIVVETATKDAHKLRERFYALEDPEHAKSTYLYTRLYQFVSFLKSTDWPIDKIYRLAHLHMQIVTDLELLYVANVQDINYIIVYEGDSLLHGFYGMTLTTSTVDKPDSSSTLEYDSSFSLLYQFPGSTKSIC